jgi:ligand-binding sensor domain-containing protein/two-component sensor histidine kinase
MERTNLIVIKYLCILSFILLKNLLPSEKLISQTLSHRMISIEEGLPDNQVFSLLQDKQGYIWFGCDAGLFKYTGLLYQKYNSVNQQARAVTGLTQSVNGIIYCFNFKGQIFYLQNDSLHLLINMPVRVSGLFADSYGKLWVSHARGLSVYIEQEKKWLKPEELISKTDSLDFIFAKSFTQQQTDQGIWFIGHEDILKVIDNKLVKYKIESKENEKVVTGNFLLCSDKKNVWFISILGGSVFSFNGYFFEKYKSKKLSDALQARKVTGIKFLADGNLWITTYSGIIRYNAEKDKVEIFFPEYSFSDIIIDREQQYWLSSPNSGLFVVPDLNLFTYDKLINAKPGQKITKLIANQQKLIFASAGGETGMFDLSTKTFEKFSLEQQSDIQVLAYDENAKNYSLFTNNSAYFLKNRRWQLLGSKLPPVKMAVNLFQKSILATSVGTFVYDNLKTHAISDTLTVNWSRDIRLDSANNKLFVATNNGLMVYKYNSGKFKFIKTLLDSVQILSLDCDMVNQSVYALTFKGEIFVIDKLLDIKKLHDFNDDFHAYKLSFYQSHLFIASNKGILRFGLSDKIITIFDKVFGLVSNDIQDIAFDKDYIWLATGKGMQALPINLKLSNLSPILFLRQIYINDSLIQPLGPIKLNHNQSLKINADILSYRSQGNVYLAYRFTELDTNWHKIPVGTEKIEIPLTDYGQTTIELSAIDYWGKFAEKSIYLEVNKLPPFWNRWWFYLIILLFAIGFSTAGYLRRVHKLRIKQMLQIEKLNLENELRLSQQAAIKAQMNPHFVFNVLNSIKAFIYENDKIQAIKYLNSFSDLVRKVLEMSSETKVLLSKELEIAQLYIQLESMLLDDEFAFYLSIDPKIDPEHFYIPSLLIQPIIENAFKHGLRHKKGLKSLKIEIVKDDNNHKISIIIIDNGIGPVQSIKINSEITKKHQSFATGAIEKRLNLLNAERKDLVGVSMTELKDRNGEVEGTKVVLTILETYEK